MCNVRRTTDNARLMRALNCVPNWVSESGAFDRSYP